MSVKSKRGYYIDGITRITDPLWDVKCLSCGHACWSLTYIKKCLECGSSNIRCENSSHPEVTRI